MNAGTFDYIIVGAGSAGCVLASRLAQAGDHRVLILESGGPDTDARIRVPAAWTTLLGSELDWGYRTVPQEHADGRVVDWPRGRVVGGSSSLNAMVFVRGHRSDYDRWATVFGAPGWSYDEVAPVFKAMEDSAIDDRVYRGQGGPVPVRVPDEVSELTTAAVEAAIQRGAPPNSDVNGEELCGVGLNQLTVRDGRRVSAADAFLAPALSNSNLTLLTNAHVTRLDVGSGGRVQAVEFTQSGAVKRAAVDGEVILTAGAIESPRLLLLSGIGPADELRRHGIDVVADLEGVGAGLHDHPGVAVIYQSSRPVPFGPNQGSELALFCHTSEETDGAPDLQFGLITAAIGIDPGKLAPENGFTFYPSLLKPHSRGRVALASSDPATPPLVDPAYLADPRDLDGLLAAIQISRELAAMPALRSWVSQEVVPGEGLTAREELAAYARAAMNTWFHPVGTCRMGQDRGAVVDHTLRVRGVENLRVADASVMPEITSGNTNAPTMMIGWRAADFICK